MKASCKDCEYFNPIKDYPDLIRLGKCMLEKSIYWMLDIYISDDNICSFYKRKEENKNVSCCFRNPISRKGAVVHLFGYFTCVVCQ